MATPLATPADGIAVFPDISIDHDHNDYRLRASVPDMPELGSVESALFDGRGLMALRTSTLRLTLALAVLGSSCGGDDLTLPNAGEPAKVEIIRGDMTRTARSERLWGTRWSWR